MCIYTYIYINLVMWFLKTIPLYFFNNYFKVNKHMLSKYEKSMVLIN